MEKESLTVLVVDDDATLRRLLKLVLQSEGFRTCTAIHGEDALRELDACRPDVIVLDVEMPVMDGLTFYRKIRERGCGTPVLLLSAGHRSETEAVGANGYMAKPFVPSELTAKVRELVA